MTKERLLSFAEYAKDAQPEVLVTLIQTIVERIYIVDRDDERSCLIFIKGCTGEDYTGFFQTAGYIEQNTAPVCASKQDCIGYDKEAFSQFVKSKRKDLRLFYIIIYNAEFEIVTEGYSGYDTVFQGWIWQGENNPLFGIMRIWNTGDMIYRV